MMRPNFFTFLLLISFLFLSNRTATHAQVWPGDVNNNGIVNHVDLIYLGEIFFQTGPPRFFPEQGIFWEEKLINAPWGSSEIVMAMALLIFRMRMPFILILD